MLDHLLMCVMETGGWHPHLGSCVRYLFCLTQCILGGPSLGLVTPPPPPPNMAALECCWDQEVVESVKGKTNRKAIKAEQTLLAGPSKPNWALDPDRLEERRSGKHASFWWSLVLEYPQLHLHGQGILNSCWPTLETRAGHGMHVPIYKHNKINNCKSNPTHSFI